MSRRVYYETTPSGREQIISVKRYRHHHHHHRRRDHDDDNNGGRRVSRDEYERLVKRENCLAETNKTLADEVCVLKTSLNNAQAEAQHLSQVVVVQLQGQIDVLTTDNMALRQSAECAAANRSSEEERLGKVVQNLEKDIDCVKKSRAAGDRAYICLEKENDELRQKIKCLSRKAEQQPGCDGRLREILRDAEYWKGRSQYWRDMYDETTRRLDDSCGMLEIRTKKMRAYEEILKRRHFI
ncbi:hypothetical protein XA68_14159 [Ophiocordyceps unilateralis]|uniref:Uncharacterized protein n=1 Tax=Ophiocordyceps unilateralis TaxID=268505 RepID=A0A2A9PLQ6_OPHUN|nr:hypothetical protein XA68_14159 [Ophiocordyceps unilateralis]